MANVLVENATLQSIADAIRNKTGKTETMLPAEMPAEISGIETGDKHYDAFWDNYQQNGERKDYRYAFAGYAWNGDILKPKYSMSPVNARGMFTQNQITDLFSILKNNGITLDFSQAIYAQSCFDSCAIEELGILDFSSCTNMTSTFSSCMTAKIEMIVFPEKIGNYSSCFTAANKLTNLTAAGIIAVSINFQWSPLSVESMRSIILCLKNYAGTDNANKYTVKFSDNCWAALEADSTAPDGGTWANYVSNTLCWNI